MLVKWTPVVHFTNILQAAFAQILFCPKNYRAKLKVEKSCAIHLHTKKRCL